MRLISIERVFYNIHKKTQKMPSLEQRKKEYEKITAKHPGFIPLWVDEAQIPDCKKKGFLAPGSSSGAQFLMALRTTIKLDPMEAIFIFIQPYNILLPSMETMAQIAAKYRQEDGFVHIAMKNENVFGLCG
jgi:Autophagy protein Atg8 ubiquitin like